MNVYMITNDKMFSLAYGEQINRSAAMSRFIMMSGELEMQLFPKKNSTLTNISTATDVKIDPPSHESFLQFGRLKVIFCH